MKFVHELRRLDMLRKALFRAEEKGLAAFRAENLSVSDAYGMIEDTLHDKIQSIEVSIRTFIKFQPVGPQRMAQCSQLKLAERYTGVKL